MRCITGVFACDSLESLQQASRTASKECTLDNTYLDVAVSFPGGIKKERTETHKLSDYFDGVDVFIDESVGSLIIHFRPKQDARRYWKDLMVRIINSVESVPGVSECNLSREE